MSFIFVAVHVGKDKVRWKMRSAECGVRSAECGVRSMETVECGKCGVWKVRSV